MDKLEELFQNPGKSIKNISRVLFYLCLIIGVLLLIIGLINMGIWMDEEYYSFFEGMSFTFIDAITRDYRAGGYTAKIQIIHGLFTMLSSLLALPLYGFGTIVENIAIMKDSVSIKDNKENN